MSIVLRTVWGTLRLEAVRLLSEEETELLWMSRSKLSNPEHPSVPETITDSFSLLQILFSRIIITYAIKTINILRSERWVCLIGWSLVVHVSVSRCWDSLVPIAYGFYSEWTDGYSNATSQLILWSGGCYYCHFRANSLSRTAHKSPNQDALSRSLV